MQHSYPERLTALLLAGLLVLPALLLTALTWMLGLLAGLVLTALLLTALVRIILGLLLICHGEIRSLLATPASQQRGIRGSRSGNPDAAGHIHLNALRRKSAKPARRRLDRRDAIVEAPAALPHPQAADKTKKTVSFGRSRADIHDEEPDSGVPGVLSGGKHAGHVF